MPTREVGRSSVSHANRRTAQSSRGARGTSDARSSGQVRVWSEASVTVNVGDGNYIKFTHGFEKLARNTKQSIVTAEREIFDVCETIVDRRIKRLGVLLKQLEGE